MPKLRLNIAHRNTLIMRCEKPNSCILLGEGELLAALEQVSRLAHRLVIAAD